MAGVTGMTGTAKRKRKNVVPFLNLDESIVVLTALPEAT
jgi:hypothetical protein